MGRRPSLPQKLRLKSQIERARMLAAGSTPLVAELYRLHAEFCQGKSVPPRRLPKDLYFDLVEDPSESEIPSSLAPLSKSVP